MAWEDLKRSIWEKIRDHPGFKQAVKDRLRLSDCSGSATTPEAPAVVTLPAKVSVKKPKRTFHCNECACRSHRLTDLKKHVCSKFQTVKPCSGEARGRCSVLLYECTRCSYKTRKQLYARHHIYQHRLEATKRRCFHFCSFCGYNHRDRTKISVHIARHHSTTSTLHALMSGQVCSFLSVSP